MVLIALVLLIFVPVFDKLPQTRMLRTADLVDCFGVLFVDNAALYF